jgi:hypothetical protein
MSGAVVRVFPSDDPDFRTAVEEIVDRIPSGRAAPQAIEDALRSAFPSVHVVEQDGLGQLGGGRLLYAYRDGAVVPLDYDAAWAVPLQRIEQA